VSLTTADADLIAEWADTRLSQPVDDPRARWRAGVARPEQILPPLSDPWRVFYLQGGRGSGKTRAGAQGLADIILDDTDSEGEYGIIAPTYADAWTKCVEGESGILRALGTSMAEVKDHKSKIVRSAWRTYGQVVFHSGLVIYVDSADEGGLRIQGRNLRAAWCDEIGLWKKWEVAWGESLKYAVRQGVSKIIATGTPKVSMSARKLIRSLIRNEDEHGGVITRRLRTIDNIANLSEAFYRAVVGSAKGTRLERQELEGELLDDVANALWTRELIEDSQCPGVGEEGGPLYLTRVYIGVDPSDGKEDSDEQAYTVVARGQVDDPHIYVLESWGGQESPVMFAKRVIKKAQELDATLVVEKNHGGEWLTATFNQVMKETGRCKLQVVHASHAKRTRAEPVSALYERKIVRHCQRTVTYQITDMKSGEKIWHTDTERFVELEDQMCSFTGAAGERSPDRLDSLVWGCTPFLDAWFGPPVAGGKREWIRADDLDTGTDITGHLPEVTADPRDTRANRRLAEAHGGAYDRSSNWGLDSFAPAEDDQPDGKHPNRHEWRLAMGKHDGHLPRKDMNKKVKGMDEQSSGKFGQDVAKGQGQQTKQDAKDAKAKK
jgi:phage terminase large subunit-like protein